jgi:selenocysteine lyase/cysteine desulfurase
MKTWEEIAERFEELAESFESTGALPFVSADERKVFKTCADSVRHLVGELAAETAADRERTRQYMAEHSRKCEEAVAEVLAASKIVLG